MGEDYMDIGGSSTLDPTYMEVKESICGREPHAARQVYTDIQHSSWITNLFNEKYPNKLNLFHRA